LKSTTRNLIKYSSFDKIRFVNVETVNGCNYKCNICHFWKNKLMKLNFQKFESLMKILPLILSKDVLFIFAGGEPTLHPRIHDMIKICKNNNISPSLITNGFLITKKLASNLIFSGLGTITISLDSYSSNIHDKIRGVVGSQKKVMDTLNIFSELKKQNKFKIGITCTVNNQNIKTVIKTVQFIDNLNFIDYIELQAISQVFQTTPIDNWYNHKDFSFLWPKNKDSVKHIYSKLIDMKKKGSKISNSIEQLQLHKKYFLEEIIKKKKWYVKLILHLELILIVRL
jgi:MoaA/NifB/PqqE/SkfB family radical SAM enzyme